MTDETKTEAIVSSAKRDKSVHPLLILNNNIIEDVTVHEHLGLTLCTNLSWRAHILKIHQKASKKWNLPEPLKYSLNRYTLEGLFTSLVRLSLEYAGVVWDGWSESDSNLLESLQIEGARVVTGALKGTSRVSLLNELSWVDPSVRRKFINLVWCITCFLICAIYVQISLLTDLAIASFLLRIFAYLTFVVIYIKKTFLFSSIKWWNSTPLEIRTSFSLGIFKHSLLKYLQFPTRNYFFCIGDRSASTCHTCLRLNFSALKRHHYQKNCCRSPTCPLCDAPVEDAKHSFLYWPSFAALRERFRRILIFEKFGKIENVVRVRFQFYDEFKSIFTDSRNNPLSAINDKRLLFGLVKTNLTHYNGPFLDPGKKLIHYSFQTWYSAFANHFKNTIGGC